MVERFAPVLFALALAVGCDNSGTIADDDAADDDAADDDAADDDAADDDTSTEDCVDPPEDVLAQLYTDVDEYLRADDPGDEPQLLTALDAEYAGVCFEHFAGAIRAWNGGDAHIGVQEEEYWIEDMEALGSVHVYVPEDLATRAPLVIWLHGAGADTGATWANDPAFQQTADEQGAILASPTCDELCDWSLADYCGAQVVSLVRHLKRRYPVDDDRVYLTGHSMGGRGSLTMGLTYPSLFAGLTPSAATLGATAATFDVDYHADYSRPHVENALVQRVHLLTGLDDNPYLVAQNEGTALAFDELGYDFEWNAMAGQGHGFAYDAWNAGLAWTMEHPRETYPAHAIWNQAEHGSSYFDDLYLHQELNPPEYWLRIDDRDSGVEPARVEGTVVGQVVTVTTDNVTELTVMLADELLDLDQTVAIEVNGETWFEGAVERSPHLALTSARERSERSMVFASEVSGPVPGSGEPRG